MFFKSNLMMLVFENLKNQRDAFFNKRFRKIENFQHDNFDVVFNIQGDECSEKHFLRLYYELLKIDPALGSY